MNKQFFIPACHKYIKTKEGSPNSQRIFSVAKTAFKQKYPDIILDDEKLLSYLILNGLIDEDSSKETLDLNQIEMCFSIITQYKCNAICQLCGYSPLYKNQLENQEAVLLGFCLSSWKNLQILLHSGVTCRHFRSVIPVSEKSAVSVVPLNRLAFEYMEKMPKCQEDMLSITDKIVASIKQNNKDKLSAPDFKVVQHYLNNLYNSNFRYLKNEEVSKCLKHFQLTLQEPEEPEIAVPIAPVEAKPVSKTETKSVLKIEMPQQENVSKKIEEEKENLRTVERTDSLHVWRLRECDLKSAPFINLDNASVQQLHAFEEHLLITPLLPMEVLETEKEQKIVIYAGDRMYYYGFSNPMIMDQILPYVNKSSFRKVLCYEPYYLYAYLNEQQIQSVEIFSLNVTMKHLAPDIAMTTPEERINCYIGTNYAAHSNRLLYCMQCYIECYKKMQKQIKRLDKAQQETLVSKIRLSKFLGISFFKFHVCENDTLLFSKEKEEGYDFFYKDDDIMKPPYCSIRFHFSWKEAPFPIEKFLENCVVYKMIYEYDFKILKYDAISVTFAIRNEERKLVYEAIHNLVCMMAENEKKTPVIVDAEFVTG